MRRNEREITDISRIYSILEQCEIISLGMNGATAEEKAAGIITAPYIVPMNYGKAIEDGKIVIYFHSAQAGRKKEILSYDPKVCVEAHVNHDIVQAGGDITTKYESVIGTGIAENIEDRDEKVRILKLMLSQYEQSSFNPESCNGLSKCAIFRVVLDEVRGKANL